MVMKVVVVMGDIGLASAGLCGRQVRRVRLRLRLRRVVLVARIEGASRGGGGGGGGGPRRRHAGPAS